MTSARTRQPADDVRRARALSPLGRKLKARSNEFIRYIEGGGDPAPDRIKLAAYLDRWLDYQRARGIRPRTLEGYEGYIRRDIVPVLGGVEIAKIKPGHVRWVLSWMKDRGLSSATIVQARGVLRSALRQAVEDGSIPVNPVAPSRVRKLGAGNCTGPNLRKWRQ